MSLAERLQRITAAHDTIFTPTSSNEARKQATTELDQIKASPGALELGLAIAQDSGISFFIRKFGLAILIHHVLNTPSDDAATAPVVPALINLGTTVPPDAPFYFISAIAALWTEVAKRVWLTVWTDMDNSLVEVWSKGGPSGQAVVLAVLESLCLESPAGDYKEILRACGDIFVGGEKSRVVSQGPNSPGWLAVVCGLLGDDNLRKKALATLRAAIACLPLDSVGQSNVIPAVFRCVVSVDDIDLRIIALDCLVDLFGRVDVALDRLNSSPAALLAQVAGSDGLSVLAGLFASVKGDLASTDCAFEEIMLAVKISDLLSLIGQSMGAVGGTVEGVPIPELLSLVLDIVVCPRLTVSSPSMRLLRLMLSWSSVASLMNNDHMRILLEHCASRLVKFETAPDVKTNPDVLLTLLELDIDTSTDRQAFLDSYRRSCSGCVELLVRRSPREMVDVMLSLAYNVFVGEKTAGTVLYVGALSTMIDSALSGCLLIRESDSDEEHEKALLLKSRFREFAREVMKVEFENIDLRRACMSLVTAIAVSEFAGQPELGAEVALMILNVRLPALPKASDGCTTYNPADRDALHLFETTCAVDLGRLAVEHADFFASYYNDWYSLISNRVQSGDASRRQVHSFHTFLFSIVLRTSNVPSEAKRPKLEEMLVAVTAPWAELGPGPDGFSRPWFLRLLGLDQVLGYVDRSGFANTPDWSAAELDTEGRILQEAVNERVQELPLRPTRYLLMASTEQLDYEDAPFELSRSLWSGAMDGVLSHLLPLLGQAQGFCNLDSWDVSEPTKLVLKRILTDRFWQSGISTESRDDFFARVNNSKTSFEGLASAVRGAVRSVREFAYWILYCFARLDAPFYSQPESLVVALYADASALSCHHLLTLLSLSRHLIMACPQEKRPVFLPPMVGHLAAQLEAKIRTEWALVDARQDGENNADLSEEMKSESVLRRLSSSAVSVAGDLLRVEVSEILANKTTSELAISTVVLENIHATSPLFLLFVLVLGVRDSQSVNSAAESLQRVCRILFITLAPNSQPMSARYHQTPLSAQTVDALKPLFYNQVLHRALASYQHSYFVESQRHLVRLIGEVLKLAALGPEFEQTIVPVFAAMPHLQADGGNLLRSKMQSIVEMTQSSISNSATASVASAGLTKKIGDILTELLRPVRGVRVAEWGKIERVRVATKPLVRVVKEDNKAKKTGSGEEIPDDEVLAQVQELFKS